MLASATSIRSVSESIPLRFFALVTSASGILPRTTWVRSPRSSPSFSAMTITSRNLLERIGLSSPAPPCLLLREELDWATRFMTYLPANSLQRHFRVAQYQLYCSTRLNAPRDCNFGAEFRKEGQRHSWVACRRCAPGLHKLVP